MLRSAVQYASSPVCQQAFDRILSPICRRHGPRLGLAISGGVDSMALASLCSSTEYSSASKPSFTAFVVDHGLRDGSDHEAADVASSLEQMNIDSQILKLDWGDLQSPNRLPNLESVARRLRFQALGRACRDFKITSLLLAHHGDDQAETVMSRILTGYMGFGLRGIQAESSIPECHGIYGVSESGHPRILASDLPGSCIEGGGVRIHRPLLDFSKDELIATCKQRGVEWFEDSTNADKTLTIRNTIRHLFQKNALPAAFSAETLRRVAESKAKQFERCEGTADAIFNDSRIELDICSGIVSVRFPPDISTRLCAQPTSPDLTTHARHTAAVLMRRLSMLADASSKISLQDTQQAVQYAFPFLFEEEMPVQTNVSVGNLALRKQLQPTEKNIMTSGSSLNTATLQTDQTAIESTTTTSSDSLELIIYPRPPPFAGRYHVALTVSEEQRKASVDVVWTQKQLFGGRFWLSIRYRPFNITPGTQFVLRCLTKDDLRSIRAADLSPTQKKQAGHQEALARTRFEALIKHHAPDLTRFALPVIVETYQTLAVNGGLETKEVICAVPSIGWGRPGWKQWDGEESASNPWRFDCRYKMVDFGKGKDHFVKRPPHRRDKGRRSAAPGLEIDAPGAQAQQALEGLTASTVWNARQTGNRTSHFRTSRAS